jgi:DNA-binding CsgD family transcriptional regulator
MGLFFLISAYFVPTSFDRNGAEAFLRDRLVRFGVPLAVVGIGIFGPIGYVAYAATGGTLDLVSYLVLIYLGQWQVELAHLGSSRGFLLKDAPGEEILRAVRLVASGGAYLDPAVTQRVLEGYRRSQGAESKELKDLTQREFEVLRLIGRGLSNDEIADRLVIGEGTVKTHIGRIFDKLGLRDRSAASSSPSITDLSGLAAEVQVPEMQRG